MPDDPEPLEAEPVEPEPVEPDDPDDPDPDPPDARVVPPSVMVTVLAPGAAPGAAVSVTTTVVTGSGAATGAGSPGTCAHANRSSPPVRRAAIRRGRVRWVVMASSVLRGPARPGLASRP